MFCLPTWWISCSRPEGHTTWSGCNPPLSKLTLPTYCNPNMLGQDMSGITALDTNNIFTIGFMAKIKVSFAFGTCLKPHNTPPHRVRIELEDSTDTVFITKIVFNMIKASISNQNLTLIRHYQSASRNYSYTPTDSRTFSVCRAPFPNKSRRRFHSPQVDRSNDRHLQLPPEGCMSLR